MFKNLLPNGRGVNSAEPKPRTVRDFAVLVVGLICAPFLFEGGVVCYSHWCLIAGREIEARTPVTDFVNQSLRDARDELVDRYKPSFQRVVGDPRIVVPVSAILTVFAMMMMRR